MGERKGTNKYYPPDFDPGKHKNLNKYHGVHALRERGAKASEGILKIRFEMPFNCFCLTCKQPIGMGVRYNAEKEKVGMFHSTPIYKFTFNCAMCAGTIVMQTDPENFDYIVNEGARRKIQTWDAEDNEQIAIPTNDEKRKLTLDYMFQLEHKTKDKIKGQTMGEVLEDIEVDNLRYDDDFALNQLARKQFRDAKKLSEKEAINDQNLMDKFSLTGSKIALLPDSKQDATDAKVIRAFSVTSSNSKSLKHKLLSHRKKPVKTTNQLKETLGNLVKVTKSSSALVDYGDSDSP
ncbi:hypothetical protein Ciccas_009931 [Cichlidogyrus casuarinus]|uniref:Uncharacterized protein n=1 Tax=Cichlidogyrus casuarinus TaxID=1844966 RepID=A0ABD2PXG5_9PLAT